MLRIIVIGGITVFKKISFKGVLFVEHDSVSSIPTLNNFKDILFRKFAGFDGSRRNCFWICKRQQYKQHIQGIIHFFLNVP